MATTAQTVSRQIRETYRSTLADGGATVSLSGEPLPDHGYLVSDDGGETVALQDFTEETLQDFTRRHAYQLSGAGAYLGTWVHEGTVYLDVTRHWFGRDVALTHAAQQNQLAIWDVANAEEITVRDAA